MIRVSQGQAAHFVLQKTYLAGERAVPLDQLARGVAGLPATSPTWPFLAARARLAAFAPAHLLAELHAGRLVRGIFMRNADYLIPAGDYPAYFAATARQRRQGFNSDFRLWGLENSEVEAVGAAILAVFEAEPLDAAAIEARLPAGLVRELTQTSRGGRVTQTSNVALALRWLLAEGRLCLVHPAPAGPEDWRTERAVYLPRETGCPELDPAAAPPEAEAQATLVRAYLAAYGPATEADITAWAGFGKSETARAVSALAGETTLVVIDGLPGITLLLKEQAEALRATQPPESPVVNLLPADDPYVTAYRASRARYFADQSWQRQVFSSSGAARPAIVVNGQIAGTWEWPAESPAGGDRLRWRLLAEPEAGVVALIQAGVERLAAFIGSRTAIEREAGA